MKEKGRPLLKPGLLIFDLDDTLLRSDKTVSPRNLEALRRLRRAGTARVGIATSRSELSCRAFTSELCPDVLITSAGAHVRAGERIIFSEPFTAEEISCIINETRAIAGQDAYMDADAPHTHYRNYPASEHKVQKGFEDWVETDFSTPPPGAVMMCVKLRGTAGADALRVALPFAGVERFAGSDWYKLTKKGVTKAAGIRRLCGAIGIGMESVAAFGDDLADVEMLRLAGLGVAMGNALPEVKLAADVVIGDNDTDAIADLLDRLYSEKRPEMPAK